MTSLSKTKVNDELLKVYQSTTPFLEEYQWEFESDRLAELIVLIFMASGIEPEKARKSVGTLNQLGMISGLPRGEFSGEQSEFIQRILIQSEVEVRKAELATKLLISFAFQIRKKWGGYIQRLLRKYGLQMANDLKGSLVKTGLDSRAAMAVSVSWLQNVSNIPVLSNEDPYILSFMKEFGLKEDELTVLLDELGLNVSVADELLTLRAIAKSNGVNHSRIAVKNRR